MNYRNIQLPSSKILEWGKQGENKATRLSVDVSEFIKLSEGTIAVSCCRPDGKKYPHDCTINDTTVEIELNSYDTQVCGILTIVVSWMCGERIVKSETYCGEISRSISTSGEKPTPPFDGLIEQVSNAAIKAKESADRAEAAADRAENIEETDPTVPAWAKEAQKPSYTASEVGADPSGTAASQVSAHNTGTDTHSDIRMLISGLTDRLNALADSDDTTLDQLSEVVAYIKSNRTLIEAITTNKVNVADIIDNLTTNVTNKPLSAAQGVALKALIDAITIPESLPNPNALTFTGAVTGSYDGSAAVSVEIPSGGSGGDPTIIFDSGEITEEVNLIGPIDISGYSRLRILGKAYPSENSAGKRAAQLYFGDSWHRLLCNAGTGKLFDTSGNPVSFLIYLNVGANALSAFSFAGFNAGPTFDDSSYPISSQATSSDGGCLVYSTTYNLTQMYLSAQDDLSTRPWGVGTRIMVIGDD